MATRRGGGVLALCGRQSCGGVRRTKEGDSARGVGSGLSTRGEEIGDDVVVETESRRDGVFERGEEYEESESKHVSSASLMSIFAPSLRHTGERGRI